MKERKLPYFIPAAKGQRSKFTNMFRRRAIFLARLSLILAIFQIACDKWTYDNKIQHLA